MSEIVELTPELCSDPEKTTSFFNTCEIRRKNRFLQLYLQSALKGGIPLDKCLQFLRTLMLNEVSFQLLLDHLYLLSLVVNSQQGDASGSKKLYKQVLVALCERIPSNQRQQLFDYLDEETLSDVGLISQEAFGRRKRHLNTQLNFVQSKFGILKDENEGFSKLMVEIMDAASSEMVDEGNETRVNNLISLIGYFDLDPDRVVDLIVESWITNPLMLSYIDILKRFKQVSVAHFLGKRFEFLLSSTGNATHRFGVQVTSMDNAYQSLITDSRVPTQNLVKTTVLAIKYRLFDLTHIWNYLSPNEADMEKAFTDKCDIAYKYYKSFDQLKAVEELNDLENRGDRLKREVFEQYLYNQKAWILQGLLSVNCFDTFKQLFYTIGGTLDLTNFVPLKKTMMDFIEWVVEPLYKDLSYSKYFPSRQNKTGKNKVTILYDATAPCRQIAQIFDLNDSTLNILEEIFQMSAQYLGEYPTLLSKLVKIFTSVNKESISSRVESIIMRIFLPATALRDCLPIIKMIWKFAQTLDYKKRSIYYSEWKDNAQFQTFQQIVRSGELAKCFLRQVFNKLDKDSKDKMMLKMAKLTHSQPLLVMNELRRDRVQNSDNNPFMVHALGFMTGLSLDILSFTLVQWLNDFNDEKKVRSRDIECSGWFKNLGSFIGAFYRKYYNAEMQALFTYICEGLASPQEIKPEIYVLKELIEKMTGIEQIEDLSADQIQALAGGRYIQLETTHQTSDYRKSRKSNQALENFFWNTTIGSQRLINQDQEEEEVSLAFLLFIILCQQRTKFVKNYQDQNLRPLSVVFDNFTWSINQLTKCLLFQTDKPTHYALLFPKNPLHRLVIDFKIPFEIAFRIVRYGHKSLYNMSEQEFCEVRDNIKQIYDKINVALMYDNPEIGNHEVQQLPQLAHTLIKDKLWEFVNPDLFAVFWLLSVDNIYVPTTTYEKQVKITQENLSKITDPKELIRQQKSSTKALEKLQNELDNNKKRKEQFDKYLQDKKDIFKLRDEDLDTFSLTLSQICILPRVLIDPAEAMYCAKFVHSLIRISKPKYTNTFYIPRDIIYYTLTYLQCCTEQESVNLSIFIMLLIQPFANWNDENKYKVELKYYFDCQQEEGKAYTYEKEKNFIVGTIFFRIYQFIRLLKNNETQVRNAMIFLKNVQDIFPPTQQIAILLKDYLADVKELYPNVQDIQVRIQTYKMVDKIPTLPNYVCKSISNPAPVGKFEVKPEKEKEKEKESQKESQKEKEKGDKQDKEKQDIHQKSNDRSERNDRSDRTERERNDRTDRTERNDRNERVDRGDREKDQRQDRDKERSEREKFEKEKQERERMERGNDRREREIPDRERSDLLRGEKPDRALREMEEERQKKEAKKLHDKKDDKGFKKQPKK